MKKYIIEELGKIKLFDKTLDELGKTEITALLKEEYRKKAINEIIEIFSFYLTDGKLEKERIKELASGKKQFFDALINEGFSRKEALKLISD